jgi:hypothetical protein
MACFPAKAQAAKTLAARQRLGSFHCGDLAPQNSCLRRFVFRDLVAVIEVNVLNVLLNNGCCWAAEACGR